MATTVVRDDVIQAFEKDVAPHHIGQEQRTHLHDDERVPRVTPVQGELPEGVKKFTADIDNNFRSTVERLRDTAERMQISANQLVEYANDLEKAGPTLSDDVRRWIQYEREANTKEKFYRTLFIK